MLAFVACVGGVIAIPIPTLMRWVQRYYRSIDARLEKNETDLKTFKGVLIPFLIVLLQLFKGFGLLWLTENVFYMSQITTIFVIWVMLIFDIWSPFSQEHSDFFWLYMLLGIYCFITPWFLLVAPLLFLVSVLLVNSIGLGVLTAIVLMFVPLWTGQFDALFFAANAGLFAIALFAKSRELFLFMDGQKETVLMAFRKRI